MHCVVAVSATRSCLPSYTNGWCMGCALHSREMDSGVHPGAGLWEHSKKDTGNKLLESLPLIGFFGCEVAISITLKFAHKYTCLLDVTFEMRKRNIISKNAEM